MATITAHYGIDRPVPFANVHVDCDNRLFLDPHAIRLFDAPQPVAREAVRALDTFFETVSRGAMSSSAIEHARALDLLQHFEEPWETRLGLAKRGFSGHGGAEDIGGWIWSAVRTDLDALLRVGILKHLEELPLFVKGVDHDITSDITTRIVFHPLANFTRRMLAEYPEFSAGSHRTVEVERQVWDSSQLRWDYRPVHLPVVNSKPLLLVPADWARSTLLMSAKRYYETSVLSYAQVEQAVTSADGALLTTPKDRLKKQVGLARGRNTNRVVTLRAESAGDDLLAIFRHFVSDRIERARRAA